MKNKCHNIQFIFKSQPVSAFVNIIADKYDLRFSVRYQDAFIREFLPEASAQVSLIDGIKTPCHCTPQAQELIATTGEAISQYFQHLAQPLELI
jgi:hypothetical protein